MKIKHKDFQTHQNSGFTLVELIVVIAILAILAAVAIPAYNGYIEKANKAADDQLIAAINKAAATAVLEAEGVDMAMLDAKALESNATKGQTGITAWKDNQKDGAFKQAFDKYFADNSTASLKYYGSIAFVKKNGISKFEGVLSILKNQLVGNDAAAAAFNASSYANPELGVDGVTEMVDVLAGALAEYQGLNLLTDCDAFDKLLKEMGVDPDTADAQTKANASVFYLADRMELIGTNLGEDQIWAHVKTGDIQTWLTEEGAAFGLSSNDAIFVSTALKYASATAYAYSANPSEAAKEIRNANPSNNGEALAIVGKVQGETAADKFKWNAYTQGKGQSDFEAFFQVMEVVNANSQNFAEIGGEDMFSSAELRAEINRILQTNS